MKHIIALMAVLLTGCGGGESQPEPVVLWESAATASDAPLASEGRGRSQWSPTVRPASGPSLLRAVTGEACFEGTWTQTATVDADVRFSVNTDGLTFQSAGSSGQIRGGATLVFPFRICRALTAQSANGYTSSATFSVRTGGGNTYALGAYSLSARWVIVGNYVP